jgi:hypothetical protein
MGVNLMELQVLKILNWGNRRLKYHFNCCLSHNFDVKDRGVKYYGHEVCFEPEGENFFLLRLNTYSSVA